VMQRFNLLRPAFVDLAQVANFDQGAHGLRLFARWRRRFDRYRLTSPRDCPRCAPDICGAASSAS
jgi:hypothetical protein